MHFETLHTLLAYVAQPPSFEDNSGHVCLLERSLYGLKQAGNVWNQELNRVLQINNFKQLKTDYCCYIKSSKNDFSILAVWVDDFLTLSTKESLNDDIEHDLNVHFKVKSLGLPNLLLGIKINIRNDSISLSQTHYIDFLLDKYGLTNVNPVSTPMDPNIKLNLEANNQEESEDETYPKLGHGYAQLISSLMYFALATCPDISFAVN